MTIKELIERLEELATRPGHDYGNYKVSIQTSEPGSPICITRVSDIEIGRDLEKGDMILVPDQPLVKKAAVKWNNELPYNLERVLHVFMKMTEAGNRTHIVPYEGMEDDIMSILKDMNLI